MITEKRLCGSAVGGSSANPISQLFSNLDISLKAGMRRISAPPNIRSASSSLHPSTSPLLPPLLPLPYTPNPPSCPPPPCTPSILLLPILNSHAPKIPLPRVHRDISHVITRRPDQRWSTHILHIAVDYSTCDYTTPWSALINTHPAHCCRLLYTCYYTTAWSALISPCLPDYTAGWPSKEIITASSQVNPRSSTNQPWTCDPCF